jgi:hypothetical protein
MLKLPIHMRTGTAGGDLMLKVLDAAVPVEIWTRELEVKIKRIRIWDLSTSNQPRWLERCNIYL